MPRQPLEIDAYIEEQRAFWIEQARGLEKEGGLPEHTLDRMVHTTELRVRRKEEGKARAYQRLVRSRTCGNCGEGIETMTQWNQQSIAVCEECLRFLETARWIKLFVADQGLSADSVYALGRAVTSFLQAAVAGPDGTIPARSEDTV